MAIRITDTEMALHRRVAAVAPAAVQGRSGGGHHRGRRNGAALSAVPAIIRP